MVKSLLMLPAKGAGLRTAVSLAMASGIFCRNWSCLFESWMNHSVIVFSLVKTQLISRADILPVGKISKTFCVLRRKFFSFKFLF